MSFRDTFIFLLLLFLFFSRKYHHPISKKIFVSHTDLLTSMASISNEPSSSSLPTPSITTPSNMWKYHVYLSFDGSNTSNNFVDHLHYRLTVAGIYTFKDDHLDRGSSIQEESFGAISESRLSLVVLSPGYASSVWCLDELVKIMGCRKEIGHMVVPIFYGFHPSKVRGQTGMYQEAFARHEGKFEEERVMKWEEALTEAGNLPGWGVRSWDEAVSIELIVRDISDKLMTASSYTGYLFGIASKMKEVERLLSLESNDVRMVGICGMGGIGKTTIAKVMYKRISGQFEACCFLANVSKKFRKAGLASLERELLSEFLFDRKLNIRSNQQRSYLTKDILRNKKILLVLDDVRSQEQLESLAGGPDWFGLGSRVIITARDKHLLHYVAADYVYEMSPLEQEVSALQLFSCHAFRRNQPVSDYLDISKDFVSYSKGLPLALKVLGSFLYNRSVPEWRTTLDNLQRHRNTLIVELLQASLEGITTEEKQAFLDIACLFNGENEDVARNFLDVRGFHPDLKNIPHAFLDTETAEWLLLYTSLVMEATSAVFEQLQYAFLGMVMAISGLLVVLIDLTIKARKEQATWERRGYLPWFYSHHPQHKLFGTGTQYFGLAAAIWQVFHSTLGYFYARKKLQNPIKMTIIMFLFCLWQLVHKLIKKYSKAAPPSSWDP